MSTLTSLVVFALILIVAIGAPASPPGISGIVSSLSDFQTPSGGFAPSEGASPTLIATENALFLSTLFGTRDQVNQANVATFLKSLVTSDNGFSNTPNGASDVVAVRNALLSLAHIGQPVPNPSGVAAYLLSTFDKDARLFANIPGGTGNLKATAHALQALDQLGVLKEQSDILAGVHGALNEIVQSNNGVKYFSSLTENNYYGIVAAAAVEYNLGDGTEYARYIYTLQTSKGGFGPDSDPTDSLRPIDSAYAVLSLHLMEEATGTSTLVEGIDANGLMNYVVRLPRDLASAAAGFKALSRTRQINHVFTTKALFEVEDSRFPVSDDRIVAGSSLKPAFSIRTPAGNSQSELDVSVTVKPQSVKPTTYKLTWDAEAQRYTTPEFFRTTEDLGRINFDFNVRLRVPDLGSDLVMTFSEGRRVGYDISVDAVAKVGGSEVPVGGEVASGATFTFTVGLGTVSNPKPSLLSGDFDVVLAVKDSSLSTIHEQKVSAKDNTKPFTFSYTLSDINFPGGSLIFQFNAGPHTTEKVVYRLPVKLVAAGIKFSQESYEIGETVSIAMTPASLTNGKLQYYSGVDSKNKPVSRRFFLDLVSPKTGETVDVVAGESTVDEATDRQIVKFSRPLSASFESIAPLSLRFRYITSDGEAINLSNYNSATGDVFPESHVISYKVNHDLRVTNVVNENFPTDGKINYGNSIRFSFKVHDAVTNQDISGNGAATAYAVLQHNENGKWYTSSRQAAISDPETAVYSIDFPINPNAQNGPTTMKLVGQGQGGEDGEFALRTDAGKEWSVQFEVGGKIDVKESFYAHSITDPRSMEEFAVFSVDISLSSGGEALHGADLKAEVTTPRGDKFQAAVTQSQDEDLEPTGYQVSWLLNNEDAYSGTYTVNFYRQVDLTRSSNTKPFFSVDVSYQSTGKSPIPIRTEFVVLLIFGVVFFTLSFRKMDLEGTRKVKK